MTHTQTFTIQGRLPGYNQLTSGHWARQNSLKQDSMDLVCWAIKQYHIKPVGGRVTVRIACYEPDKRRDPSNVRAGAEKVILDALQEMGIIKNDNWACLDDCPARVELDRMNARVKVEILEMEG